MSIKKKHHVKLLIVAAIAVILWTVAAGFNRDLSASNEETYKGLKLFSDVIEIVEKNYVDPVETKKLIQKAIQGMVHSLDPHSSFLPPEAFEELKVDTKGEFGGIGIVITVQKGILTVISPIEGTPAHKAGVMAGDKIIKVNGESTQDMALWQAVKKMRGPKGTAVEITVRREKASEPIEFKLVRDIIPIVSVKSLMLKPGYGYIRITNFQDNTTDELLEALNKMKSGDMKLKGLVLDLRDNPGGLLDQAISVTDVFLDKGEIVSIKGRLDKHTKIYKAHPDKIKQSYPVVLLINGGSASASEIVAGALQDHKRALILGTTSFGKGSVQTVESLRDGYGLKFTIARYYTPNGKSIQAQGITPDVVVKQQFIDLDIIKDNEKNFLKEKDLKNHLEAEPQEEKENEGKPGENSRKNKEKLKKQRTSFRHGPLDLEILQSDNQIIRSLEILVSYEIFKDLNG
jgi:carboxyl-terminal processing protease